MPSVSIAGMHRSGTSMVVHLLKECGLYLGPDEKLLDPAPGDLTFRAFCYQDWGMEQLAFWIEYGLLRREGK